MKKTLFLMLFMLFSLVLVIPTFAFANEKVDQELEKKLAEVGEISYIDDEITVWTFGDNEEVSEMILNHPNSVTSETSTIDPKNRASINGPGGRATITASDSGRGVYWSVKPKTAWPYHFSGVIKLRYHSGFKRDQPVGGMGALGSTVSGAITMNKNNGGVAYLSGTAYALNNQYYTTVPGIHTSFRPN